MSIRKLAYDLWCQAGRPEGDEWRFWFAAEAICKKSLDVPGCRSVIVLPIEVYRRWIVDKFLKIE